MNFDGSLRSSTGSYLVTKVALTTLPSLMVWYCHYDILRCHQRTQLETLWKKSVIQVKKQTLLPFTQRHIKHVIWSIIPLKAVLQKMQNPGSPNGPPMVDGWVIRFSSGWSVNHLLRPWNQLKLTNIDISEYCPLFRSSYNRSLCYGGHGVDMTCDTHSTNHDKKRDENYLQVRFHSEIFVAKAQDFIGRHMDHPW